MLVDAQARILHANRAAAMLLQGAGGLNAGPLGLRAGMPAQTNVLQALVARASGPGLNREGGTVLVDMPGIRDRCVVHIAPCREAEVAWIGGAQPTAIVVIGTPRRRSAAAQRALEALFGLTAAEARVTCLIAEGTGVQAAAADLGVEASTVRTHLVRAYAKTGTRRQAELAKLVEQFSGVVSADPRP